MGAIGGLLGTAGGAAGSGFSGPQAANITNPVTGQQITDAYTGAQNSLQAQQSLLSALQQQNGLANQSSVYNQLQNVASGQGPNPAKAQLAQATGQNIAAQGALMAGQRGANSNVGLMARQIAQQGAATQQQAVGQGATMQAQQSLGALQNLGNLATTQAGQQIGQTNALSQAQQAEQSQLLGAQAAYNSAQQQSQASMNQANAALAGTSMQGQQQLLGGLGQVAGLAMLAMAKGGDVKKPIQHYYDGTPQAGAYDTSSPPLTDDQWNAQKASPVGAAPMTAAAPVPQAAASQPAANASTQPPAQNGPKSMFANFLKSKQAAAQSSSQGAGDNKNPMFQGMSTLGAGIGHLIGNAFKSSPTIPTAANTNEGSGFSEQQMQAMHQQYQGRQDAVASGAIPDPDSAQGQVNTNTTTEQQPAANDPTMLNSYRGGRVPAMVSPGEQYLPPRDVEKVKKGADPLEVGEKIPGTPKVKGARNSYKNDTVRKDLEEGGIVIPRSVTQGPNPHWESMKFVYDTLKKGKKSGK